jgi:hypothetical protein
MIHNKRKSILLKRNYIFVISFLTSYILSYVIDNCGTVKRYKQIVSDVQAERCAREAELY